MRRLLLVGLASIGCARPDTAAPVVEPDFSTVRLVWVQGHEGETWEMAQEGLRYQLAHLGAVTPAAPAALEVVESSSTRVVFDLDWGGVGLSAEGQAAAEVATASLLDSDEMAVFGAVDLGRFLMRTLYHPWYYLAITEACPTLEDWRASHLSTGAERFAVNDSLLVEGDREIVLNPDPVLASDVAFEAAEGTGSLDEGDFEALEHEVVDLMASGAQRYAIYGADGGLAPVATESPAGTTGRCMWCHEADLQSTLGDNTAVPGYLSPEEFVQQLAGAQAVIDEARGGLSEGADFRTEEVHTWGELLAETFLTPSAARVAGEWGVDVATVEALAEEHGLTWSLSEEYPAFPPALVRAEVDEALSEALADIAQRSALDLELTDGIFEAVPVSPSARALDAEARAALDGADAVAALNLCAP